MDNRIYALQGAFKRTLRKFQPLLKLQRRIKRPVIVVHPAEDQYRELSRTGKFSNVLVKNSHRTFLMLLVVVLLASACGPAVGNTDVNLPDTGTGGSSTDITPIPVGTPPPAVLEAVRFLSDSIGVSPSDILVLDFTQVDWPNACLGLPEAGEACAEVITPGYRVILEVNGQEYELHTDAQGVSIRQQ